MKNNAYPQIWKLLNVGLTSKVFSMLYSKKLTITELARLLYDVPKNKRPYRNRIMGAIKKLQKYNLVRKKEPRLVKGSVYYETLVNKKVVKSLLEIKDETAEELSYIFNSNSFRQICGWKENEDYFELIRKVNDMPLTGALLNLTNIYFEEVKEILKICEIKVSTKLSEGIRVYNEKLTNHKKIKPITLSKQPILPKKNVALTTREGKKELENILGRYKISKRELKQANIKEIIQKIDVETNKYSENIKVMFAILPKETQEDLILIFSRIPLFGGFSPASRFISRFIYGK